MTGDDDPAGVPAAEEPIAYLMDFRESDVRAFAAGTVPAWVQEKAALMLSPDYPFVYLSRDGHTTTRAFRDKKGAA